MLITNNSNFNSLISSSDGCFVYSGSKKYLDFNLGSGSFLIGHRNKLIIEALDHTKKNGSLFVGGCTLLNELYENFVACHPLLRQLILSNTGSEAVLRSIRIARGLTGKNKIILLRGAWHGSHDQTLFDYLEGEENISRPLSAGIPQTTANNVIFIDPCSDNLEDKLFKLNDVACILFEPIQGALPISLSKNFHQILDKFIKEKRAIAIFDEIISGHRVSMNGIYNAFKNIPLMVLFGKSMGGGIPISAIGISRKLSETYKDQIEKNHLSKFFFGGTFTGNPLSVKSAILTLKYIKNNKNLYTHLEETGAYLRNKINLIFKKKELDFTIVGFKSISKIINQPLNTKINSVSLRDKYLDKEKLNLIRSIFQSSGIHYGTNNLLFTCQEHDYATIDNYLEKLEKNLENEQF